jgi:serine/threonine-protein kinase HipA
VNRIDIFIGDLQAGWITHTPDSGRYAFDYTEQWLQSGQAFPISPLLPLQPATAQTAEAHSTIVRLFFENLLPEGRALDEAAAASQVAKSNLIGLMLAIGRETAGALRLGHGHAAAGAGAARLLPPGELSARIRARPQQPFSVWDGRVRLSIAGYQDKLAVFKNEGQWFLPDGPTMASTVILKPEPPPGGFAGLVSNEFFCMRLARHAGLPSAAVQLAHVPEPVLEIERFDRRTETQGVTRLHVIDGCQALGLAAALKYERTYGNSADVRHLRDGASLPALFGLLERSRQPAPQRLQLLRWVIFQILIGNNDAHAKNLSLFCDQRGIRLAPCYDLVSTLAFAGTRLDDNFAMAIGDAFTVAELTPFEWAHFAHACGLKPRLVANEIKKMLERMPAALAAARAGVLNDGADMAVVDAVQEIVTRQCERQAGMPGALLEVDPTLF